MTVKKLRSIAKERSAVNAAFWAQPPPHGILLLACLSLLASLCTACFV
jgi:hypothetical protein